MNKLLVLLVAVAALLPLHVAADSEDRRSNYVKYSDFKRLSDRVYHLEQLLNGLYKCSGGCTQITKEARVLNGLVNTVASLGSDVAKLKTQVVPIGASTDLTVNSITASKITVSGLASFGGSVTLTKDLSCASINVGAVSCSGTVTAPKVVVRGSDASVSTTISPNDIELVNGSQKWDIEVEGKVLVLRDNTCGGDKRFAFYQCPNNINFNYP